MHFVGQDPKIGGTSLAVLQFVAIARGEIAPHVPRQSGVRKIRAEVHYCHGCFGDRAHDVVYGSSDHIMDVRNPHNIEFRIAICRVCGKEGAL